MKFLFPLSVLIIVSATFYLDSPAILMNLVNGIQDLTQEVTYEKELHFSGLHYVQPEELQSLLPMDRSVLWWKMNRSTLKARIKEHVLVEDVDVHDCSSWDWSCFRFAVKERSGRVIALVGERLWLLGGDGGYIAPLPYSLDEAFAQLEVEGEGASKGRPIQASDRIFEKFQMTLVKGIDPGKGSPESVKARFHYLIEALELIEKRLAFKITFADLKGNGELEVSFFREPYKVLFGFETDDSKALQQEVDRLDQVLEQFHGREEVIERIDLAYDKLAVVKFVEKYSK